MKFRTSCSVLVIIAFLVLSFPGCKEKEIVEETPQIQSEASASERPVPRQPPHLVALPPSATISYADSADRLEVVPAEERDDQIRDWTVLGLAGLLGIDTETLRDFSYDRTPIRDPLFAGIATEAVGPGRYLPDGSGTLHLLVPAGDPYAARTIGLLLDDYRKDSGNDPANVRVHRYTISHKKKIVSLETGLPRSVGDIRTENGYVEMAVQDLAGLESFLSRTQHLSKLENRGGTLWASGWSWPGIPGGKITVEDISVLQRGYRRAKEGLGPEPGFSLDPGEPLAKPSDLLGFINAHDRPIVAEALGDLAETSLSSLSGDDSRRQAALERLTFLSLPNEELAKLARAAIEGEPVFQFARYDGGVNGTEVGMTYFYTDIVAKAWPMEKGTGIPAGKVPGFISDLQAQTPWGHCGYESENGRLWFGLREEAVRARPDQVELGSLATRLFSLVKDGSEEGEEIEPSYHFGRIMWWWDRHYQAMADYEPQYHRLDQLMRWGAAIAWLVNQNSVVLPEIAESAITTDRHFFSWLAAHQNLKWHWKIPVVKPKGVGTEALLTVFSATVEDCANSGYWGGGISGPARERLAEIENLLPDLKPSVARAGTQAGETNFSAITRAGRIASENVARDLRPVQAGKTVVGVMADGRKVWSLSNLKAWVGETAKRRILLTLESAGQRLTERVGVQGLEMGELSVTADRSVATVTWQPGLLDRADRALSALQEKLLGSSLERAAGSARGASLIYTDPVTRGTFLRIDGATESHWMAIEKGAREPGSEMAFRLGQPGEYDGEPAWFTARFSDPPVVKTKTGAPAEWLEFETGSGGPARISGTPDPPGSNAEILTANSGGEGPQGQLYIYAERDKARARRDDPLFGLRGTREGYALLEPEMLKRSLKARQAAKNSGDGYQRGIPLKDSSGVALVHGDEISILGPAHPWHQRVQQALRRGPGANGAPLFKIDGQQALLVDARPKLHLESSPERKSLDDAFASLRNPADPQKPRGPPVYFESSLAKEVLVEGKIPSSPTGKPLQVRVVTAQLTDGTPGGGDLLAWDHAEWTQPAGSVVPAELKPIRQVQLVYRSGDCDIEPRLGRCEIGD